MGNLCKDVVFGQSVLSQVNVNMKISNFVYTFLTSQTKSSSNTFEVPEKLSVHNNVNET